ncbi:MAG TPA: signal peptidase I [Gaiellaceae bacterium]
MIRRALFAVAALVGLALVVGVVFFFVAAKAYRIPASSMEPTLHCARPGVGCQADREDHVLAIRYMWPFRGPRRGDVVALKVPARAAAACGMAGTYVKRVIALPGESFAEREGAVYVNRHVLREPYVKQRDQRSFRERRVPEGSYFVLGDARDQSCDSRVWGPVPKKNLIARVVASYWPPRRIGLR